MPTSQTAPAELLPLPDGLDRSEVRQFLYREARYADEADYDAWEALWTDDSLYWVPASTADPLRQMSIIYDNRSRISTRLKQARTGRRYAQAPPSRLRRLISNIEFLGMRFNSVGSSDLEVEANFLVMEARPRGTHLWGGRTTYRVRGLGDDLRLSYKKVVLIDNDQPLPTLGFLI